MIESKCVCETEALCLKVTVRVSKPGADTGQDVGDCQVCM